MRNLLEDGCTQAANAMQQRKVGATIFHLQVAPGRALSEKSRFLLLFGAKTGFFIRKGTVMVSFFAVGNIARRVAPFPRKKRVAPGCTRNRLPLILAQLKPQPWQ
ncbi:MULTISPECIES: hypothetical protein [unclassified Pseudomonas]|uniref:hypothetical protein n=1 Tax=unclassified Pseudomonas TaxID=196821 RepID=UPI00117A1DFF|nr:MULTISPECIES: hypothetical protein [unclassified Pseudomonas]